MSPQIKAVVFDLDGTLVDSSHTIYEATLAAFKDMNIDAVIRKEDIDRKIGAHFREIFEELEVIIDDVESFISIYKRYYFEFINTSKLYPGVIEVLQSLHSMKIKTALLTTKNQEQAEKIIHHFNLSRYFDYLMGRRPDFPVKPAPEPLLHICKELETDCADILFVGDTEFDIRCGKNAGSSTCAVSYGYRTMEQIEAEKPDYIINSITELNNILQTESDTA